MSSAKKPGRVDSGGDPALARGLASALMAAQREASLAETVTHPFHAYPARMHPATARQLLDVLDVESVLDPFCGSGTTLVEARVAGLRAAGVDINPLAVAIARAKTWTVSARRRAHLDRTARHISTAVLAAGKAARRAGYEPAPFAPNRRRNAALRGWFAPHVRRELEEIAIQVDQVAADDPELGDVLRVALSSVLYKVSRRTSDTDTAKVERRIARGASARLFRDKVALLCAGLAELAQTPGPLPEVICADARHLPVELGTFDVVITSPPYVGTYDYVEQHRLRMAFLGFDEQEMARGEIASRRSFRGNASRATRQVERDLGQALGQAARAVAGGPIALVIGDSLAGGRSVAADELVRTAAGDSFEVAAWAWQERPKLGGERAAFGSRPKREHIIVLRQSAQRRG